MENMISIPGYSGKININMISSLTWEKGERSFSWCMEAYAATRNNKTVLYYVMTDERFFEIKWLFHKYLNTSKPKSRPVLAGQFRKANVKVGLSGKMDSYKFKSNKAAKKFHDELLAMLQEIKFTCQFEKEN